MHHTSDIMSSIGLTRCADVPCLRSLVPGQTLWFANLPRVVADLDNALDPGHQNISLVPSEDGSHIEAVEIILPGSQGVRAGDIVLLYGPPCRVDIRYSPKGANVVFQYPGLYAQLDIGGWQLNPDTRIHFIILRRLANQPPYPKSDPCAFGSSRSGVGVRSTLGYAQRSWRGFTSLRQ